MRKFMARVAKVLFLLLCMNLVWSCGRIQEKAREQEEQQAADAAIEAEDEESKERTEEEETEQEESLTKDQYQRNQELFYEATDQHGMDRKEAGEYFDLLCRDDVFRNDTMEITGLMIEDIDGNGQKDMLAMVFDGEERPFYGGGCIWLYMNEDQPYCFDEEGCSYNGWFDVFWADIDNDENVEIVLSAQGTGCGAVGDSYKVIFKYKDHGIELMELPSELPDDAGVYVDVMQYPEENSYSAYCKYLADTIFFCSENLENWERPKTAQSVGSNVRGFYDLRCVEYEGKNALQASEYLHGEGGIANWVGTAHFLIVWDDEGKGSIAKWWVEGSKDAGINNHESRIAADGDTCYYASQLDHYYLYCAEEGGSARRLLEAHVNDIHVDGEYLYFVNLSDGRSICRMKTDGSKVERLCEAGQNIYLSAEYVYFCSTYDARYDTSGLVAEEPSEYDADFLYRMKKDGSERELLLPYAGQCVLSDGFHQDVQYAGNIYCARWDREQEKNIVSRYNLKGQNEQEICSFDFNGALMVYGNYIYCLGTYGAGGDEKGRIGIYSLWDGEYTELPDLQCHDYCIYNGYLYGLCEQVRDDKHMVSLYQINQYDGSYQVIYQGEGESAFAEDAQSGIKMSDLYTAENGIFLRRFVSDKEGCQWFRVSKEGDWEAFEDEQEIPVVLLAAKMEYTGEYLSIKSEFQSTKGYEAYLSDDLVYEEYYRTKQDGTSCNPYSVCLPQFNDKIAGYKKINQYFQDAYEQAIEEKQSFFDVVDEALTKEEWCDGYCQRMNYDYIFIGERYVTVAKYKEGYFGGRRNWDIQEPVTFDRKTGEVVTLGQLFGTSEENAVAQATASIYKHKECEESYFLKNNDLLTNEYDPAQFFLFPEGIGIYYKRYAIDCGAAGDQLFVIPWEEAEK